MVSPLATSSKARAYAACLATQGIGHVAGVHGLTCEAAGSRYTIIKNGHRRLFMPNAAFITREFMVVDGPERRIPRAGRRGSKTDAVHDKAAAQGRAQAVSGPSDRPVWLNSPPYS